MTVTTMYVLWAVVVNAISPGGVVSEYIEYQTPLTAQRCNEKQMNMGVRKPVNGIVIVYECRPVEII